MGSFAQQNAAATTAAALVIAFFLVNFARHSVTKDSFTNSYKDYCLDTAEANLASPRPLVYQMDQHCSQVLLDQRAEEHICACSAQEIWYEIMTKNYQLKLFFHTAY